MLPIPLLEIVTKYPLFIVNETGLKLACPLKFKMEDEN
jgi:hypothetical protein